MVCSRNRSDALLGPRGTVVFLHGAPTQSYSCRVVMSQVVILFLPYECLFLPSAPDWLGFGFSDKPQAGFDGFDYTGSQQSVPPNLGLLKKIFMLVNFAYTLIVLNYSGVGFMVLSLHETLTAYGSVCYIGT
ncbi:lysophospholipid acyltransferase 1-like protein [Tanacetum coccineum]